MVRAWVPRILKHRISGLLVIGLMLSLTFLTYIGFHPVRGSGPPNQGVAIWTRTEKPSRIGFEAVNGVAVDGAGIYLIGLDVFPGNAEWRIEKRSPGDGSVMWTQVENPSTGPDVPYAIAVDGTGIYIAGYDAIPGDIEWKVEKRSLTTGALIWTQTENPSTGYDIAKAVAVDASGLYVAGYDQFPGDFEWHIEKRSLTTGALMTTFGTAGVIQENPSPRNESPTSVAVDATGLYVSGNDQIPSNYELRIEKRSPTTGAFVTAFGIGGVVTENLSSGDDGASAVAVDGTGVYVVGFDQFPGPNDYEWFIEKHNLSDGSLISSFGSSGVVQENLSSGDDEALSVAVDGTGIYVGGYQTLVAGDDEWRVEKRALGDGVLIWSQTENPSVKYDEAEGIAVDGTGVYVVGYDESLGISNDQWRIEKRNPVLPGLWVVGVPLVQGWNLISLPVVPISTKPSVALATIFPNATVSIIWSFTGSPMPGWKFFNPKLTTGNTLTAIADGMGLWVQMTLPATLYVEGYVIPPAGSPSQYSLVAGWNLVGFKPQPDPTMSETVSTYLAGISGDYNTNNVWLYDNPTGTWIRTTGSTFIPVGEALWVHMTSPASLRP